MTTAKTTTATPLESTPGVRPSPRGITLNQFLTKSTIYQRNEARRVKTLTLKDDPRPAAIRVLSGLPGFRIIIPPYEPKPAEAGALKVHGNSESSPADLTMSGDTVFRSYVSHEDKKLMASSCNWTVVAAAAASGAIGGGVSEAAAGLMHSSKPCKSPFAAANTGRKLVLPQQQQIQHHIIPVIQSSSTTLSVLRQHVPFGNQNAVSFAPSHTSLGFHDTVSYATILGRALPMAILFGSKTLVEMKLSSASRDSDSTRTGSPAVSLLAGAFGGSLLGAARVLSFKSIVAPEKVLFGRNITAGSVYFFTYEVARSLLREAAMSENKNAENADITHNNTLSVAGAGALAGMVYESILNHPTRALSTSSTSKTALECTLGVSRPVGTPVISKAVLLRAAPTHALLFLCYETAVNLSS